LNYHAESELLDIVENILQLDDAMRFAAIIDLEGNIVRPLSAGFLPATDPEMNGLIKR